MEKSFKPSLTLKILMGLVASLVLIALFFFVLAFTHTTSNSSTSARPSAVDQDTEALQAKVVSVEAQLLSLRSALEQKDDLIAELEQQDDVVAMCDDSENIASLEQAQDELIASQNKQIACQQNLSAKDGELETFKRRLASLENADSQTLASTEAVNELQSRLQSLQEENQRLSDLIENANAQDETESEQAIALAEQKRVELDSAKQTIEELQAQLLTAQEENQNLVQLNEEAAQASGETDALSDSPADSAENAELLARLAELEGELASAQQALIDTSTIDLLQTQLTQTEDENSRLLALVTELQASTQSDSDEETATVLSSNTLRHTNFQVNPDFCSRVVGDQNVCVNTIEISLTFNFNPNGFIGFRLVDPNGDTVDRQSIAGRTVNTITFEFDDDEALEKGEYTLEFKIEDVFNKYNAAEQFTL